MHDTTYLEDDDPPRFNLDSPIPDLLRGWHEAGSGIENIFKDAVSRTKTHPETAFGTPNRLRDVRIHTQTRQTYADPREKTRIVNAATRMLDDAANDEDPENRQRCEEAIAVLAREDERVFVALILGTTRDIVYWNWRYGYTLLAQSVTSNKKRTRFNADLGHRRIAAPALARLRYGDLVTDVSKTNDR